MESAAHAAVLLASIICCSSGYCTRNGEHCSDDATSLLQVSRTVSVHRAITNHTGKDDNGHEFTEQSGWIGGDDILVEMMTLKQAMQKASSLPDCEGFTFKGAPTHGPVQVFFKRKWNIQGSGWTSYKKNQSFTGGDEAESLIPPQLVMTGPFGSLEELPPEAKENLENTRAHAPGLKLRYLSDTECHDYLLKHFDSGFAESYHKEQHGSFRGDLCRVAVLLREGGFYLDLDFQLHAPIKQLIDPDTTFMTSFGATFRDSLPPQGNVPVILNAILAAKANSPVLQLAMDKMQQWYTEKGEHNDLLGPVTLAQALEESLQRDCPEVSLVEASNVSLVDRQSHGLSGRLSCGNENFHFYQEEKIGAGEQCLSNGPVICPQLRSASPNWGNTFAVFSIGSEKREARLIGWPRYVACDRPGCGITGTAPSLLAEK